MPLSLFEHYLFSLLSAFHTVSSSKRGTLSYNFSFPDSVPDTQLVLLLNEKLSYNVIDFVMKRLFYIVIIYPA